MIMVTAYVDMETLLELQETNEKDVMVALTKSEHENIEVQIPLSIIKSIDEEDEIAVVSKFKYARYFQHGTVIPDEVPQV